MSPQTGSLAAPTFVVSVQAASTLAWRPMAFRISEGGCYYLGLHIVALEEDSTTVKHFGR